MPADVRWIALRAAVLATAVLGAAFAWTPSVHAVVDIFPPDGATGHAPLQMMNGDDDFWGSGWWIVMGVMMVFFWGAIIVAVVWGTRQFTGDRTQDPSALDIAKERLARGEITSEEFDRIRGYLT